MSFENKVVIITGSGSGLGKATAVLFAENGADVVIVDRNEKTANKAAKKCKVFGKRVLVIKADISKDKEAINVIEETISNYGKLDILVNNAGITKRVKFFPSTIMDTYDEVMNINLRAAVHLTSLATPHLVKTKGCIVNISSAVTSALRKGSVYASYCISKMGLEYFTRLAAMELGASGIRVNAVSPGPMYTNIAANSGMRVRLKDFIALRWITNPREVGELILYLASDKAKSITGSVYVIDKGFSIM